MDFKLDASRPAKKAFSLLDEFKAFTFKGNMIDLAVGVIIGAAFANIIKSLVDNIIMPTIGVILPGDKGYEAWALTVHGKAIPYGKFLGDFLNFLIVSIALFIFIVKFLGWLKSLRKDQEIQALPLSKDQELLTEIRDLLKSQVPREKTAPDSN